MLKLEDSTNSLWKDMYRKDKYARDRVLKAACLLRQYVKEGDTVLDVGCFTQETRKYFGKFVTYIGIDQKAYHPETRVMDFNHGFAPISCKGALALETLEHLVSPIDSLESIHKSIYDDGFLVVSLPNEATLFHRIRCLLGIVDAGCFQYPGKHLHLPSLKQCRNFLSVLFDIQKELYYICPTAYNSQQRWVGQVLSLIPDGVHQWLADSYPSLFARGFIFLLKKKS